MTTPPDIIPPTDHKFRATVSTVFAGIAGFISWLATVPPEQQSGWLAQLVEITPVQWRANVGLFTRFLALFLLIYGNRQASKSGPAKVAMLLFLSCALSGCLKPADIYYQQTQRPVQVKAP